MSYRLFVTIIFLYNFFASDTYAQNSLISKSVNITSIIGFTVEFTCPEYAEPQEPSASVFTWIKNGKSLHKADSSNKMSLVKLGEILRITNITNKDEGTYECHTFNRFQSAYSAYKLTVNGLPKPNTYHRMTLNETLRVGKETVYVCIELFNDSDNIEEYKWLKDGKPFFVENERITWSNRNGTLSIKDITYEDKGTYECLSVNTFRIDSTIHNLNVVGTKSPSEKYYPDDFLNTSVHLSEKLDWNCYFDFNHNLTNIVYTWFKHDKPLEISEEDTHIKLTDNNMSLYLKNITFDDAGNYKCFVSNEFITFTSYRIINVSDYPELLAYRWYTSNISLITGGTLELRCNVLQKAKNYKTWISWKRNGEPLILDSYTENMYFEDYNKLLKFYNITSNENGTYECEALNYYHTFHSVYTINVVDPKVPEIYNSSDSTISLNTGESLQLYCYVRGMPTPALSWLKDGRPFYIPENNDRVLFEEYKQILLFNFTVVEDVGSYKCNASNKFGSNTSIYNLSINDKNFNYSSLYVIAIYLIGLSVLLLSGILAICCVTSLRREQNLRKELESTKLKFLNGDIEKWNADLGIEEQTDLLPYDKQWEFSKNKLKLGKQLGSGAFGVVFKADAFGIDRKSTLTIVAVKMVKSNSDPSHIKALISELKIMIHIGKHLNIVNLLGACTGDITNNLMVIVEYCRFGSIREYLLKQRDNFINQITSDGSMKYNDETKLVFPNYQNYPNDIGSFERSEDNSPLGNSGDDTFFDEDVPAWCSNYHGDFNDLHISPLCTQDLISWSFQVSRGMEYLSSKKVLHGDLAIRNILLADDNVVKICDFGLAKTMHNYDIYKMSNKVPLPVKWMAIESLRDQVFSTQSDVWSFGILLWELFSLAETPYPNVYSFNDLYVRLVNGYRMQQPKYANHQIYDIMYDCWQVNPNSRPSFNDLTGRISALLLESSKSYYVNLNEEFVRMNTKPSHPIHYENVSSSPNYSFMSDKNSDLYPGSSKYSESYDDVEIEYMVHNPG